ncbi:hypothetical protein FSP39_023258 [Pinctada imbricata]|uniref:WSC domain-containing protein n=1 Tax=Pinctada imbricata TaxID=66713 RepID=A0AA89CCY8_PINIB|nr:hypothetical protein FSP39_023258 [Pinctada imbricata]
MTTHKRKETNAHTVPTLDGHLLLADGVVIRITCTQASHLSGYIAFSIDAQLLYKHKTPHRTLYLSYSYYNWTNSLNGCGSRSIATLQNTPLNSSEWSSIKLDSEGAWLGSYYSVTPFYWTNGECFQFNSSALKDISWKAFRNLTAEKCAFFCASKSSLVKYIALQDTHCYCLDKKPDTSFSDGCKTNCTGVLNKRCGRVQRESIFAYRKLEGASPTRSIVVNSKSIQSDEINTKSTVNISNTNADKEGRREDPTSSSSTGYFFYANIGAAIGGIIGVAVILVLIGILVFCLYKRKSKNLKRTPSYREPKVEYSSKRKDSEFEVLNTSGNNNKVGTPPSKPVRRTKSGKGSVKGTEYENIVLELEDPKLLTKAISQGSNGSYLVSRMKTEAESEYSHIQGKSQKSYLPNDQENHYDSGKTVKAEANVNDIHGESEKEYDVMNRDRFRENEDPNTEYDHIQNVINSKDNLRELS